MPSAMPLDPRDVMAADSADAPVLQAAVERRCQGAASLVQTVPVRAQLEDGVLDAVVHVFDLADGGRSSRAYAWTAPIEGTERRRIQVTLHIGPIKSPSEAVLATAADDLRARRLAARQPLAPKAKSTRRYRWLAPKLHALGL